MATSQKTAEKSGERIAKVMARAGLCSRRDAERWIADGRVSVNGRVLETPAHTVTPDDVIKVDGQPLPAKEPTRLWLYHKPRGLVTSARDEKGRDTVFQKLPAELPRLVSVGRLDINTEGLLLLTNDGGLARTLELPATGWTRRYKVRAFGRMPGDALEQLAKGMTVEGVRYGPVQATVDRGDSGGGPQNLWMTLALQEGKNREIKVLLNALGLEVSRLIRLSYGPFQLGDLQSGTVKEVKSHVLREQLGKSLIEQSAAFFPKRNHASGTAEKPNGTPRQPRKKPKHAHRRRSP
ncbi:MAG: pseudouridine synthase [Pseudomonadota bacterium]